MKNLNPIIIVVVLVTLFSCQQQYEGTKIVTEYGNENCIELTNASCRVVLEPDLGGRVLLYELEGNNILWINKENEGKSWTPGVNFGAPGAGRFDIGPEATGIKRPVLWLGTWEGRITGPRKAVMTSQLDSVNGVQLIRSFTLAEEGSHLTCKQEIRNVSEKTVYHYHWSRTLVEGGGISLTPMNPLSRYPKGYIIYGPGNVMDYRPAAEPNIRLREGVLEILGSPSRPKFVMDCSEGWLAYVSMDDQLFIKKFEIYPKRVYGDMAGNTASIYYYKDLFCEVEPLGPLEIIPPGQSASFTEHWYLFDYNFPPEGKVDLGGIKARVESLPTI
ncbi:hypothetical protein ACFLTA_01455 [Bacteroidota bacterium]